MVEVKRDSEEARLDSREASRERRASDEVLFAAMRLG